jgi:hypothetical protein
LVRCQTRSLHDFSCEAVLARIEVSFGALEAGKISAATFEKIVLAERDTLLALADTVQMPWAEPGYDHPELEIFDVASSDRKDALTLIEHCLAWAESYQGQRQTNAAG